jgi:hypothetical protein
MPMLHQLSTFLLSPPSRLLFSCAVPCLIRDDRHLVARGNDLWLLSRMAAFWSRGRCYDHNFRRFYIIFGEQIAVFLKNQCYDQLLKYFSFVLGQKRQFFRRFFCENILKIITSVPERLLFGYWSNSTPRKSKLFSELSERLCLK